MRRPSATVMTPPLLPSHRARTGRCRSPPPRVARDTRPASARHSAYHRRAGALEFADLRQDLAREEDRQVGQCRLSRSPIARSCVPFRNEYSRHTATASTSWRSMKSTASSSASRRRARRRRPGRPPARRPRGGGGAARDGGRVLEQVVEAARADRRSSEHVAHPARGDERGARALALEQRIGDDGGRMREPRDVGGRDPGGSRSPPRARPARPAQNRAASSAP